MDQQLSVLCQRRVRAQLEHRLPHEVVRPCADRLQLYAPRQRGRVDTAKRLRREVDRVDVAEADNILQYSFFDFI